MIDATPLLRAYARRRARQWAVQSMVGPAAALQERTLVRLVRAATVTRFGREHDFERIASVEDFQARVPLRTYELFWEGYWHERFPLVQDATWPGIIPLFAETSGTTTGATKFIPVTRAMVRANRGAALDVLAHHMLNRPATRVLAGKNFILGGSTALTEHAFGVRSGDLSGIAAAEIPWWARPRTFPPHALALITDWERKIAILAPRSLEEDIRSISGTPSWLLVFFERVLALVGSNRLVDAYPNLELVVHGGVGFAPYEEQFRALLEGSRAETREVYPASEGFVAIADRAPGTGLRLNLDRGLFFEFVPVDELETERPTRHWVRTIETGLDYAIVLTTCAGLWAYILGDTARFVERAPARLVVTGRVGRMLSAFGEHVIGIELEIAVADAARAIEAQVSDFAVGPIYPRAPGERGYHLYIVEFTRPVEPERAARFAAALDRRLQELNLDYRAHRAGDVGMAPPRVVVAPPGAFAAWMKRRGQLGGQHKVPRIILDPDLLEDLRRFVAS
jgi:hypothetical protein